MKTIIREINWLGVDIEHWFWNWYILLDPTHYYFNSGYDDIEVEVHGGFTYSEFVSEEIIKNFSTLDINDLWKWMLGFDTNHYGDNQFNCDKEYVENELERINKVLSWELMQDIIKKDIAELQNRIEEKKTYLTK